MPRLPSIRSTLLLATALLCFNLNGFAQTTPAAQEILDSMIKALGGQRYLDTREIWASGRFFTFRRDELATSDLYADYIKFPDKERTEFGKERERTIYINNGDEGWNVTPPEKRKGEPQVQEQSLVQIREFRQNFTTSFDYMMRFVVKAPKTSVLRTGSELLDYKRTDILEIRDADKNLLRVYVDRETHLPVKSQARLSNESIIHEEVYANWHEFDGVMTPLMVVRYKDGAKTMEIRAEEVAYDSGLDDSLFAPPDTSKK